MMETKWTPGPWVYDVEDQGAAWGVNYSVQSAEDRLQDVAEMVGREEDARLIAAAPRLYELLSLWRARIDGPTEIDLQQLLHMTDAALAKARGETK